MTERSLSTEEMPAHLGVNPDTIYKWIAEKNMPAHRIGRPWKFKKDEVDEWVRNGGTSESDGKGAQS